VRAFSPTPFGAYVDAGSFQVLSASPERFVRIADGVVETRPIKGTRRRGRTEEEDAALRADLLASDKDAAELLMIVDLERNDLGRVARAGSVRVGPFPEIEAYSSVSHLMATVRASLRAGAGPVDVLRAVFPGGSITGAPKIRAMQILEELEPVRRKFAMGSLLAWDFAGAVDSSILIRTLVVRGGGGVPRRRGDRRFFPRRSIADGRKAEPLMAALDATATGVIDDRIVPEDQATIF
jgi:para-aminobenzoate synthetase component 1